MQTWKLDVSHFFFFLACLNKLRKLAEKGVVWNRGCCRGSVTESCLSLCSRMDHSMSSAISQSLLKFMSIVSVILFNHLILCHPFLLPSIFPTSRVFSNESALCFRWPKVRSFSFSVSPSNECSWSISFRIDSVDHLAIQGTLKSLLQHHNSKAPILWRSDFWMV